MTTPTKAPPTEPTTGIEAILGRAENPEAINDGSDIDEAMNAYYQAVEDRRVLLSALATAKDEERAAFSAYAHQRAAEWESVGAQYVADVVREYGEFVEAGRHRGEA